MNIEYLRSFRFMNVALFDYIVSYLALFVLLYLSGAEQKPIYYISITPLAVIAHVLVGQKTTITENLFSSRINFTKIAFIVIGFILKEEFI